MKIEDGFLLKKEIKIKYVQPKECKERLDYRCTGSFVPTKKSQDMCLYCKRLKQKYDNNRSKS